jgi:G3E family GTPase
MKRKDKFDYILVETTGLADPAPVAQTFLVDDEIRSQLKLDAIVTVADAKFLIQHLDDEKEVGIENEAVEQIAFADRVLLNKIDLVSDEERKEVIRRIRLINANAEIIPTTMSQVDLDQVLGVGAFDLSRVLEMEPEFLLDTEHQHDLSITSVGIDCEGKVSVQKINEWLGWLLGERGTDIFRMKGILNMWGDDRRFVFQGVHMLFDGTPGKPWGDGEERRNRMVFIGRNLDRQDLERRFKACIISSEE